MLYLARADRDCSTPLFSVILAAAAQIHCQVSNLHCRLRCTMTVGLPMAYRSIGLNIASSMARTVAPILNSKKTIRAGDRQIEPFALHSLLCKSFRFHSLPFTLCTPLNFARAGFFRSSLLRSFACLCFSFEMLLFDSLTFAHGEYLDVHGSSLFFGSLLVRFTVISLI